MRSATTAEQITVGTTRTWFRTPTRPSGRGYPRNFGPLPVGASLEPLAVLFLCSRDACIGRFVDARLRGRLRRNQVTTAARACQVVRMDVRTGRDVGRGGPNRAAVLHNRLAGPDRAKREFVPAWNRLDDAHSGLTDVDHSALL